MQRFSILLWDLQLTSFLCIGQPDEWRCDDKEAAFENKRWRMTIYRHGSEWFV
jgi:hypothetical protein